MKSGNEIEDWKGTCFYVHWKKCVCFNRGLPISSGSHSKEETSTRVILAFDIFLLHRKRMATSLLGQERAQNFIQ